jgi:plasmid segregation protein ParM
MDSTSALFTQAFKTQTRYIPRENICDEGHWPIALDIGYSGVKGMSPNAAYSFPSFARELDKVTLGNARPSDILYRDENGKEWITGDFALSSLRADDTNDSRETLYGRHRYFSPMFLVLARVGIAMGMQANKCGRYSNQKLRLQTGLPPAYMKADAPLIREAIAGQHKFAVKFGQRKWQDFDFTIEESGIDVIEQPMGAVISASKSDEGKTVLGGGRKPYIEDRILVADGGFGTFDTISIYNRLVESEMSFTDVGMSAVFSRLSQELFDRYSVEVSIHALQNVLENGCVYAFDRASRANKRVDISDILRECNEEICNRALDKLESNFNYLQNHHYLLAAGGACAAWLPYIKERYAKMESLVIITGDQNDTLGPVFSNVRGYYIFNVLAHKA